MAGRIISKGTIPRLIYAVVVSVLLLGFGRTARALNPSEPPGGNFDLSHWKLTLPIGPAGDPTEISHTQLVAGFTNAYFYTAADGSMTFWCPVDGVTTGGSSYPRCELREEINGLADDDAYWTINQFPVSELTASVQVQQYPNDQSKQRVIIGQIHGSSFPLLKLVFEHDKGYGAIVAMINENTTSSDTEQDYTIVTNIQTNITFSYDIKTVYTNSTATLDVSVNGGAPTQVDESNWISGSNNGLYFKAGDYVQESGTSSTIGGQVAFYSLSVTHGGGGQAALPPQFDYFGINSNNNFSMVLSGAANSNYVIQASTDMTDWTSLATNSSPNGIMNFVDSNSPIFNLRFYRAIGL